jgi:hypothetical protein
MKIFGLDVFPTSDEKAQSLLDSVLCSEGGEQGESTGGDSYDVIELLENVSPEMLARILLSPLANYLSPDKVRRILNRLTLEGFVSVVSQEVGRVLEPDDSVRKCILGKVTYSQGLVDGFMREVAVLKDEAVEPSEVDTDIYNPYASAYNALKSLHFRLMTLGEKLSSPEIVGLIDSARKHIDAVGRAGENVSGLLGYLDRILKMFEKRE